MLVGPFLPPAEVQFIIVEEESELIAAPGWTPFFSPNMLWVSEGETKPLWLHPGEHNLVFWTEQGYQNLTFTVDRRELLLAAIRDIIDKYPRPSPGSIVLQSVPLNFFELQPLLREISSERGAQTNLAPPEVTNGGSETRGQDD